MALREAAAALGDLAADTHWYHFGSSLVSEAPNDVDVLIVYSHDDVDRAVALHHAVKDLEEPFPLDVLILSASEDAS